MSHETAGPDPAPPPASLPPGAPPLAVSAADAARARQGNWFLWWMVGDDEIATQLAKYKMNFFGTIRGQCLLLFLASAVITALVTEFVTHDRLAYIDAAVFIAVGVLIAFGFRWAMILGMVVWTIEKAVQAFEVVTTGRAAGIIGILLFWTLFMHAMFLAFHVEQARRRAPVETVFE